MKVSTASGSYDVEGLPRTNVRDMYTLRMRWLNAGRSLESYHSTFYTIEYQESLTPTGAQVSKLREAQGTGVAKLSKLLHIGQSSYKDVERGVTAMPYQIFELMMLKKNHRGLRLAGGPSASWLASVRKGLKIDTYTAGALIYSTAAQWTDWEKGHADMPIQWYELFQLKAGLVVQ